MSGLARGSVGVVVALCLVGNALIAEGKRDKGESKAPPEWLKEVTLTKPGKEPRLKPCRMSYSLSWNNLINAGEASIVMRGGGKGASEVGGFLKGEAKARSSGAARFLWAYDCELKSEVDNITFRPRWFEHSETENGETVSYRTDFKSDQVVTMRREVDPETGVIKSKKSSFKYANVYDLLSSILCLRSLPLKNGETIVGVIQPFDSPYLVSFEVQGRESRKYHGRKMDTIRLGVEIQKINKDLSLKAYKKMKTATLWVSEDDFRLPLEIRADIFIGYVAATLVDRSFLTEAQIKSGSPIVPPKKPGLGKLIADPVRRARQWWEKQSAKSGK